MVFNLIKDFLSYLFFAQELCQVVGPLEAVYMTAPGVAEVVFKYKDDALEAYRKYNQRNLDGQPMICRVHPASRGSGGGRAASGSTYGSRFVKPNLSKRFW